uniref:hypothetical protein n=1 Tax=Klebsiella TaxID=570 RepID=UPI001CDB29BD|nr:hypothetical protein [Klebsiella michiganensis]
MIVFTVHCEKSPACGYLWRIPASVDSYNPPALINNPPALITDPPALSICPPALMSYPPAMIQNP